MNSKWKKIWMIICSSIILVAYVIVHTLPKLSGVNYGFSLGFGVLSTILLIVVGDYFGIELNLKGLWK